MSPDRRKVVRLEDSKENWKKKALERAAEIRRLKERLSDVEDSRDSWKAKASDVRKELEEKTMQEKEREAGLLSKAGVFFSVCSCYPLPSLRSVFSGCGSGCGGFVYAWPFSWSESTPSTSSCHSWTMGLQDRSPQAPDGGEKARRLDRHC